MKQQIIELAKQNDADIIGFAPASRFPADDEIFKIFPKVKTVIGFAFRILRGIYRGIEEGSTFYQYTTMAVENMEETIMPMCALKVANLIEQHGYMAVPQRRHLQIMKETDKTNPEKLYDMIYRGKTAEHQMNFENSAVLCGLGELGFHGVLLTDDFGPMVRYCFVLTDAEFDEYDEVVKPHLCDGCLECKKGCPGGAINDKGEVDSWRCAVYYKGAAGKRNPFMPPEAYDSFDDKIKIIAGEAEIDEEKAKKILDATFFYPPAGHFYDCSICGRSCDIECYVHLEEKGVLKKKFKTPFRKREKWQYDMSNWEK